MTDKTKTTTVAQAKDIEQRLKDIENFTFDIFFDLNTKINVINEKLENLEKKDVSLKNAPIEDKYKAVLQLFESQKYVKSKDIQKLVGYAYSDNARELMRTLADTYNTLDLGRNAQKHLVLTLKNNYK